MFEAVEQDRKRAAFVQTALWFIGEYGDLLLESYDDPKEVRRNSGKKGKQRVHFDGVDMDRILSLLKEILDDTSTWVESKMILLTALFKLSDRFDMSKTSEIRDLLDSCKTASNIELSQRANECGVKQSYD